jgi:hypothetical protein
MVLKNSPDREYLQRYSIVDETRMREEAEKLQAWTTGQGQQKPKAGARVRQFKRIGG